MPGVGGVHSSKDAANPRGAKGPYGRRVFVREEENRLDNPTTEQATVSPALSSLRRKLSEKAKQEPKFRSVILCMSLAMSLPESRMRETCKSGLTRGRGRPSLLYR